MRYLLYLIFILCICILGFGVKQEDFVPIILSYTVCFSIYAYLIKNRFEYPFVELLALGFLCRFILVFSFPALSDDIYRFIWDGRLLLQGENPFHHLPTFYLDTDMTITGIDSTSFQLLNSPHYYTVYPPVAQSLFGLSVLPFNQTSDIAGITLLMKVILFVAECLSIIVLIKILKNLKIKISQSLVYVLNPLIIVELMGNLHFEGVMMAFFLIGMYFLLVKKDVASGLGFAFSIGSKLTTFMFIPLLAAYLKPGRFIKLSLVILAGLTVVSYPFSEIEMLRNFYESIGLYFTNFEFNASLYYILRWVGFQVKGYNLIGIIGPSLASLFIIFLFFIAFRQKIGDTGQLTRNMLTIVTVYLFMATTVHPWYLCIPVLLSVFTNMKYALIWSYLICLTYINYNGDGGYHENLWVVAIEYALVAGLFIYELYRGPKKNPVKFMTG